MKQKYIIEVEGKELGKKEDISKDIRKGLTDELGEIIILDVRKLCNVQ